MHTHTSRTHTSAEVDRLVPQSEDVGHRVQGPDLAVVPHLSTDGFAPYVEAIRSWFLGSVDYGQVVKNDRSGAQRRSPAPPSSTTSSGPPMRSRMVSMATFRREVSLIENEGVSFWGNRYTTRREQG